MIWFRTAVGLAVATYCLLTGFSSLKQKRYVWGSAGVILAVAVLFMPVVGQRHAVEVTIPVAD